MKTPFRSLAALSLCGLLMTGCGTPTEDTDKQDESQEQDREQPTGSYQTWGVTEITQMLEDEQTTSVQLVEDYRERISAYDQTGEPALNAVVELNPEALADARLRDQERANGQSAGALHGVPVLVKANIASAQMPTSAGSAGLASYRPAQDADLIKALRSEGAIILGSTNMSEFAWHGTFTQSSITGTTGNIYDADLSASGSSGGAAVALAAGFAPLSIGTDSCGSVVGPAAHAGMVGFRPSTDAISREGVVPLSPSQDVAGPMGHSVRDVALAGSVMHNGTSAWSEQLEEVDVSALTVSLIEWPFDSVGAEPEAPDEEVRDQVRSLSEDAYTALLESGVQEGSLPELDEDYASEVLVDGGWQDMRASVDQFLAGTEAIVSPNVAVVETPRAELTLADLADDLTWDEDTIEYWMEGPDLPNEDQEAFWAAQAEGSAALEQLMQDRGVDALIYPTSPETAAGGWAGTAACGIASNTGAPSVQVPVGVTEQGLPVGLTVTAAPGDDVTALAVAAQLESAVGADMQVPQIGQDDAEN